MPQLIKSNGSREEFDEAKLRTGFARALHRRPVPTNLVEDAISRVTQIVLSLGEREIESRRLGDLVMSEVRPLDTVAYVRVAAVSRAWLVADDFRDVLREVQ